MTVRTSCGTCGAEVNQPQGAINRAIRQGKPLYCDRTCAGAARRVPTAYKKNRKRDYDAQRRVELGPQLREQKRDYHQRTYDPDKARERRQAGMSRHVERCRRPEYRAYKADYDRDYRAQEYGEFADAYLLLLDLEREIRSRASSYERRKARGYYTRAAQQRRRELWQATAAATARN